MCKCSKLALPKMVSRRKIFYICSGIANLQRSASAPVNANNPHLDDCSCCAEMAMLQTPVPFPPFPPLWYYDMLSHHFLGVSVVQMCARARPSLNWKSFSYSKKRNFIYSLLGEITSVAVYHIIYGCNVCVNRSENGTERHPEWHAHTTRGRVERGGGGREMGAAGEKTRATAIQLLRMRKCGTDWVSSI